MGRDRLPQGAEVLPRARALSRAAVRPLSSRGARTARRLRDFGRTARRLRGFGRIRAAGEPRRCRGRGEGTYGATAQGRGRAGKAEAAAAARPARMEAASGAVVVSRCASLSGWSKVCGALVKGGRVCGVLVKGGLVKRWSMAVSRVRAERLRPGDPQERRGPKWSKDATGRNGQRRTGQTPVKGVLVKNGSKAHSSKAGQR